MLNIQCVHSLSCVQVPYTYVNRCTLFDLDMVILFPATGVYLIFGKLKYLCK